MTGYLYMLEITFVGHLSTYSMPIDGAYNLRPAILNICDLAGWLDESDIDTITLSDFEG